MYYIYMYTYYIFGDTTMKPYLEDAYPLKTLIEILFGNEAWLEIKQTTNLETWKKYSSKILAHAVPYEPESRIDEFASMGQTHIDAAEDTEELFASLAATLASILLEKNAHELLK